MPFKIWMQGSALFAVLAFSFQILSSVCKSGLLYLILEWLERWNIGQLFQHSNGILNKIIRRLDTTICIPDYFAIQIPIVQFPIHYCSI